MKNLYKFVSAIAVIFVLIMSSAALQAFAVTHTLQYVQTPAVSLYASQTYNATTMVITPVPTDLAGNALTMSSFGSGPTLTVDPGILGAEEIETFTSFTNNGNNTATLGGITRGLQSVYPYTSGTGVTHGAGATVVFSNNPQLYNRLASWENDGSVTGVWSFVTQPVYSLTQTFTNPLALVDLEYVNALSIVGAPTSTFNGMGVSWLATNAQIAAGTASSTTGAPLVIPAKAASSTYNGATAFNGLIPALRSTKDIDPNFIATSTGNNYTWGGTHTFNATTTVATSTVASTTITTANVTTLNVLGLVSGTFFDYQQFTGNGTWTKPNASTSAIVVVEMWGGGGGGGIGSNAFNPGGGGGGGACFMGTFRLSDLSSTETITVAASAAANTAGNSSSFGSHLTVYGGGKGGGASWAAGSGGGGGGLLSIGGNGSEEAGSGVVGGAGGGPAGGAGAIAVGSGADFGGASGGGHANAPTAYVGGAAAYGGGGGGAGSNTAASGGNSYCGGAGGGGGGTNPAAGGTSSLGGAGGAGSATTGSAGVAPGGGGGGGGASGGGAGARGEVRVWVMK